MSLTVCEGSTTLEFTFEELMKYHGPGYPGGVAHGFTAMRVALPLLGTSVNRREVKVRTAFRGPGGRDSIEMVLRAVTEDRYTVTAELEKPERGTALERYVWEFDYRGDVVTVQLRDDGFVVDEFIVLSRKPSRTEEEEAHLAQLKLEMTDRLLSRDAQEVYEVV
ncbi:hypothetical protein [Nocardia sp. XZ_19_385]|uniref:hypothetical protein n=1 Tax=Nocardia sp. XZ_19_385 TaxID=2769488 RepID=UPI00188E4C3E|nr:hypothetical protein [Nocardia sp. XZ_19_385]